MTVSVQKIDEGLIDPLTALYGTTRQKNLSLAAFKAGLDRLRSDLRYLTPAQLGVVRHEAEEMARAFKAWPVSGLIIERAHVLFHNPDIDRARTEGIARFMRCKVGVAALDGDYAVEMLADLRARGPGGVTGTQIQIDRWKDSAHQRRFAKGRAERQRKKDEVAFWEKREAEARAMVIAQPEIAEVAV